MVVSFLICLVIMIIVLMCPVDVLVDFAEVILLVGCLYLIIVGVSRLLGAVL